MGELEKPAQSSASGKASKVVADKDEAPKSPLVLDVTYASSPFGMLLTGGGGPWECKASFADEELHLTVSVTSTTAKAVITEVINALNEVLDCCGKAPIGWDQ